MMLFVSRQESDLKQAENEFSSSRTLRYLYPYASFLSKATYFWLFPLLKLGYERPIELDDLGILPKEQLAEHQYQIFNKAYSEEKNKSESKARPVSLWKCYWKTFKYSLLVGAFLRFLADIFALAGPLSINFILDYVKKAQNESKYNSDEEFQSSSSFLKFSTTREFFSNGFIIAILVFIATCLQSTFSNTFNHFSMLQGIHLRSALQCLVYKKSLRMTVAIGKDTGALVNHMSQDAYNLMMMFSMGHYIWSLPLKVMILLILLYIQLGTSALVGAAAVYILAPIQYYLASNLSKIQKDALKASDERLKKTSELLMGIKLLKLFGWEINFADKVTSLRAKELKMLKKDAIYVAIITFITQATTVIVTLVTFSLYSYIEGEELSAGKVFTGLALFNQLTVPLYIIPFVIPIIINAFVSTKRLSRFLSQPEIDNSVPWRKDRKLSVNFDISDNCENEMIAKSLETLAIQANGNLFAQFNREIADYNVVEVKKGYFSWCLDDERPVLRDINLKIPSAKLTMIWGANGSGKTSLVSSLIGEMVILSGTLEWSLDTTSISYLPQEPWLLNVTLRDNILFGLPMDVKRYRDVIEACALQPDIDILPARDRTEIGERGVNLSGGQKQRIALARALYSRADTVVLDTPLSALDSRVSAHIFEKGIKQFLLENKRTVIMVTHKLEYVQEADKIIVMEKGQVKFDGTFCELINSDREFSQELEKVKKIQSELRKDLQLEDRTNSERQRLRRLFSKQVLYRTLSTGAQKATKSQTVPFFRQVSHDLSSPLPCQEYDDFEDELLSPSDLNVAYESHQPPTYHRMRSEDSSISRASSGSSSLHRRHVKRFMSRASDKTIEEVEENPSDLNECEDEAFAADEFIAKNGKVTNEEERVTGKISKKVYLTYVKAFGPFYAAIVVFLIALTQASKVGTDFWLAKWTETAKADADARGALNASYLNVSTINESSDESHLQNYLLFYVLLSLTTILLSIITNILSQITSLRAVRKLHQQMLSAIVRAPCSFFDSTPIGRILNRFSSDMTIVDKKLPTTLPLLLRFLFLCFSAVIVDIIVTPVFIFIAIPIIAVYYMIQKFFRFTSRELQRLDNLTKSPIFAHFNQTLSGLSTIRAFQEEDSFISLLLDYINVNNLTFLMANCANCWLGWALDALGAVILLAATITTLLAAIYGTLSASLVGMSIAYTLLVPIYLNWVVRNLASLEMHMSAVERIAEYSGIEAEDEDNICNPKLVMLPGEWPSRGEIKFNNVTLCYNDSKPVLKSVAVCGRTGSGKSSLVMALFKMIKVSEGSILIDNIDIKSIAITELRRRLALVPQDTVLFSGTLRDNLDPGKFLSDEHIWYVLKKCHLHNMFSTLDDKIVEDGQNLSAGQKQLLCLARALIKNKSILIMDEATSSLDQSSEQLINKIVTESNQTVLSIIHRVSNVFHFDTVIVLQAGIVHEIGSPSELMTKKNSLFYSLLKGEGEKMQEKIF